MQQAARWQPSRVWPYSHELLHLLPLHARLELALFRCIEADGSQVSQACSQPASPEDIPVHRCNWWAGKVRISRGLCKSETVAWGGLEELRLMRMGLEYSWVQNQNPEKLPGDAASKLQNFGQSTANSPTGGTSHNCPPNVSTHSALPMPMYPTTARKHTRELLDENRRLLRAPGGLFQRFRKRSSHPPALTCMARWRLLVNKAPCQP